MDKTTPKLSLLSLCLLLFILASPPSSAAAGRKVGGRKEIKNVESNEEVQELGRYCVSEYNRELHGKGGGLLSFSEVVKAEKQVVAGIKYYLKISAANSGGARGIYDAVVVVKPWEESREILDFSPSSNRDASKQYIDILV